MKKILVFRIGQLGDTIMALPALRAVRRHFHDARITLLCDRHRGKRYVLATDLLAGSGLIDDYLTYAFQASGVPALRRPLRMAALLAVLRARRFDAVVYLAPSLRTPDQIQRDRRFFQLAGIRRLIGFEGFTPRPVSDPSGSLPPGAPEGDLLLRRLAASGISVPPSGEGSLDLGLGESEESQVRVWLSDQFPDGGRAWLGIGPGTNLPVNRWPEERFIETVQSLITEYDLWPVVIGGPDDRTTGDRLIQAWKRGYNAAGRLAPRASAAALARCRIFIGHDAGPIHLAAAVGTPCVGVYSSRDYPRAWFPYGKANRILRRQIACEGCLLVECVERRMECILSIRPQDVVAACREILERS